jgi:hypothetical protein
VLTTPTIPSWIREFEFAGYTNVFALHPQSSRLYGTETLFPDWGAETLLLAKDAAPTSVIRELGWRHAARGDPGGWRTNERLEELAKLLPGTKLYGSATANMLYDHPGWSRALSGFWSGPLHEYLVEVLRWVIASMPNVRAIACLGAESWHLTASAMGMPAEAKQWARYRDQGLVLRGYLSGKPIMASAHYHPAARELADRKLANWRMLGELLRATI